MSSAAPATSSRSRLWPAAALPAGLAGLLALAVWLFAGKVAADQERADAAALRLESYARLEAGELAARAAAAVRDFAAARRAGRQGQDRNLRLEARGLMDAVHRVLSASMEKSRTAAAARRDAGVFPPGFDGVRGFLEIAPLNRETDRAAEALGSIAPELASLLPAGCSLAVVEDNSREILSLGGGSPPENAVREAVRRDFLFDDGGTNRLWTLRVEVTAADAFPEPAAGELAAAATDAIGPTRLDGAIWRGWLLGPEGRVAAAFPAGGPEEEAERPLFMDKPREWVEVDGGRLVWLEPGDAAEGGGVTAAVSVSIDRPPPPLDVFAELRRDTAWCATLALLAGLTLAGWVWFFRSLAAGGAARAGQAAAGAARQVPAERPAPAVQSAQSAQSAQSVTRRRLVRSGGARPVPEGAGVIVADLDGGTVRLAAAGAGAGAGAGSGGAAEPEAQSEPEPAASVPQPQPQRTPPSGSLYRLQAIHRGGEKAAGSRALDGAASAVLRELAARVRPVLRVEPERGAGRGTERITREVRKVRLG